MKRLIVCADGTWNKPDQEDRGKRHPSNVVKFSRSILPRDSQGIPQVTFYHRGVGTNWGLDKIAGGGFGRGLSENILQCYEFLLYNYVEGDEIFLFGFSRGAYTVRSLSSLIERIGLLPKANAFWTPEGYTLYRDRATGDQYREFREQYDSPVVPIHCLGVWDTVGALGVPLKLFRGMNKKYQFHSAALGDHVHHGYQALAVDERRKPFAPAIWVGPFLDHQTVEQAWFSGVHTNIGGGYNPDGLANISLHWMKKRAQSCGLAFNDEMLNHYSAVPVSELRESMTWFYRLLGSHIRPIPYGSSGNESVHRTVYSRMEKLAEYRPENVPPEIESSPDLL